MGRESPLPAIIWESTREKQKPSSAAFERSNTDFPGFVVGRGLLFSVFIAKETTMAQLEDARQCAFRLSDLLMERKNEDCEDYALVLNFVDRVATDYLRFSYPDTKASLLLTTS